MYEKYDLLNSFLRGKLSESVLARIAQPIVENSRVTWMGEFPSEMKLINEFPETVQRKTEEAFAEWLSELDFIRKGLQPTTDPEKKNWAELLGNAFNVRNNFLISDGENWAIVWGWEFNNKLKFISPDFLYNQQDESKDKIEDGKNDEITDSTESITPVPNTGNLLTPGPPISNTTEPTYISPQIPNNSLPPSRASQGRIGFWESLKRFFRWLAYRFWGLMMLLIYTLLILCFCRKCLHPVTEDCSQFNEVEKKLKHLQGRMEERCPEMDSTISNQ